MDYRELDTVNKYMVYLLKHVLLIKMFIYKIKIKLKVELNNKLYKFKIIEILSFKYVLS